MKLRNKIFMLSAGFLLIHFALKIAFTSYLLPKSEVLKKFENYKKSAKDSVKILLLGDSHVERSIKADEIAYCKSLAYYGENNVMCYYRLKYCISNKLPLPEYLVLPCDLVTFTRGFNNYRAHEYFYYSIIDQDELNEFEEKPLQSHYKYLRRKLFPYTEWQSTANLNKTDRKKKGTFRFSDLSEKERKKGAENFIMQEMWLAEGKQNMFCQKALDYLSATIALCKEHNIKPLFVRFPLTQEVMNEVREHVDSTYISNRPAEKILRQHQIPLLDMENVFSDKPYLFFDCHHLNDSGKKVFTPLFREKLDSLMKVY